MSVGRHRYADRWGRGMFTAAPCWPVVDGEVLPGGLWHAPDDRMMVNMARSLSDEVAAFVKAKGNASAYTARILRRQMLSEELEKSARGRTGAGIVITAADPAETEDATLARWARVAGR